MMTTGKKILFLLPFAPRLDATHGGGRVIAEFLAEITTRHRVALLYLREPDEPPIDPFFLPCCERVEEVRRHGNSGPWYRRYDRYLRRIWGLVSLRPLWSIDFFSRVFTQRARLIVAEFDPDIIQIEYHVMGQYLPTLINSPAFRILVEHEPGIRSAPYLQGRLPSLARQLVIQLEKLAWRHYETALLRRVDAVITFSETDRQALEQLDGNTPIIRITPGTPIPAQPFNPLGASPWRLLFIGNFIHPPNTDAALRLIRDIFPVVQQHFPGVQLIIVGDHVPDQIRRLASKDITVTGRVPKVELYLDQAALFVVPLRLGGGVRIKMLEALAAGKAIVASPRAIEGLVIQNGRQVVLAESDAEFCDAILRLLADPVERQILATNARAWACENLGWEKSIAAYEALYSQLSELSFPVGETT